MQSPYRPREVEQLARLSKRPGASDSDEKVQDLSRRGRSWPNQIVVEVTSEEDARRVRQRP